MGNTYIALEDGGLRVGDRLVPLLQAEFHFFRNRFEFWPLILDRVRDAGFPMVTSYIQWNWHELEPGVFDFAGATVPERNVPRFLNLCAERGLGVHLRLAPACCEWRVSGASSFGTAWRDCFDAFWPVVAPYRGTKGGPLWMLQVHNEWSDLVGTAAVLMRYAEGHDGFRETDVPYDLELSGMNAHYRAAGREFEPGILAEHAKDRYRASIASLNRSWNTAFPSFDDVAAWAAIESEGTVAGFFRWMNRRWGGAPSADTPPAQLLDLLDGFRLYMAYALRGDVEYVRRSCDLPLTHNWAMGEGDAFDRRAGIDLSGYDMYAPTGVKAYDWLFTMADLQANRIPYSAEFMCGTIDRPLWGGQGRYDPGFVRMEILSWFALGLRGVNLYMFVERDSWRCCPVDRAGGARPSYAAVSSVIHGLRDVGVAQWRRQFDLTVVKFLPYHQAASDAPECHFDRGFSGLPWLRPFLYGQDDPKRAFLELFHALCRLQADFEVIKVEPGGRDPAGTPVLLVYSLPWMDRRLAERLERAARDGAVVVFYPHRPVVDMQGRRIDGFEGLPRCGALQTCTGVMAATCGDDIRVVVDAVEIQARVLDGVGDAGPVVRVGGDAIAAAVPLDKGRVIVAGADLAERAELLSLVIKDWAAARTFARVDGEDAGASLFETGEGQRAVIAYNGAGTPTGPIRVTGLPDGWVGVRDLLDAAGPEIRRVPVERGRADIPACVPARDALLLLLASSADREHSAAPAASAAPAPVPRSLSSGWEILHESPETWLAEHAAAPRDDTWFETPAAEWTLPALASGRVLGVVGWFWFRADLNVDAFSPAEIRIRPRMWHNLGVVFWDGTRLGSWACERPAGEVRFEIPPGGREAGPHTLAIRLFRPTLECHDVGSSGFDSLRIVGMGRTLDIDRLWMRQERRDEARTAAPGCVWKPVTLPWEGAMRRGEDRLWLRTRFPHGAMPAHTVRLIGDNAIVTVYAAGARAASTPYLPADLPLGEGLPATGQGLLLRVDPDDSSLDAMPRDSRFDAICRGALDRVVARIGVPQLV